VGLIELFVADLATTTVSSGGTDAPASGTQETLTVASSAMFGTAVTGVSQFHFADTAPGKGTEIYAATATSGTTWTVTRGAEGTTPVTHAAGFTIVQVATAGFLGAVVTTTGGAGANLPLNNHKITSQANGTTTGDGAAYVQVYEVLNVKGLGAAGNGVTDDSAIINNAITTAHAAGGGVVMMPPGAYALIASGLIMKSSVTIRGAGYLKSTLRPASGVTAISAPGAITSASQSFTATNASPCVFTVGSGSAPGAGNGVTLTGGSLPAGFTASTPYYTIASSGTTFQLAASPDGAALASSGSGSGTVVQAGQITLAVYEDFGIAGPGQGTGSAPGMALTWCTTGTRLHRMYITTCGSDGIAVANCYTVSLRDNFIAFNGGSGLNAQYNINSWDMSANSALGNTRWGYSIMGGAASVLSCCDAETNGYGGMALLGTYSFTAEGCELENNGSNQSAGQQCGIYIGAGTTPYGASQNATLRGNLLQGTSLAQYGIVVDSANLTEIAGNAFENNLTNNILVTGNATATLIRHGNYPFPTPSAGNIADSGTHTQMMDYDAANAVMRSSGFSFGPSAGVAADITLLRGTHPGQLVISGAAPTFGAVLRVTNTVTGTPTPGLYLTAIASTDLLAGGGYAGLGFIPWQVRGNGKTEWGSGSGLTDTFLARSAAGVLQVTSALGVAGLAGATAASRYAGATASGAPTSGTFALGDLIPDQTGKIWVCTVAGTPGTWVQSGSVITGQFAAQGLNGTGTAPTIAGVTHCAASAPVGHDLGGSFTLTTDATSAGAGTIATITLGTPLGATPAAVLVSMTDTTATVTNVTTVVVTATSTVITIQNTAGMPASHTFLVTYAVTAS
jgi:hypothetical protein